MTWFADLTTYTYGPSPGPGTLNVGWLDAQHAFASGDVPSELVARLSRLPRTQDTFGLHVCELCPRPEPGRPIDGEMVSTNELHVVGADGTRYAAPSMIVHYIKAHRYAPPQAFIDAVLR